MQPIRVAHVINSMEVGGAQTQVANLFRAVDRKQFDLRLICLAEKGAIGEQLESEGFPVVSLGKRTRIQVKMLRRLVEILRQWRPDIVHTTVFTANLWGRFAAILSGTPVLISHEQSTVSLEKWHRRMLDRTLSWKTDRILAVSQNLRRRILSEERISAHKVRVLYNAIDTQAIRNAGKQDAPRIPGEPGFRIGVVGRLEYRKDHPTLVRAAKSVVEKCPRATFLIAGEGPDRPKIEAEIAQWNLGERVILLGERRDVPRLLHAFDLYVLSSITEGLSLSILEAMAAGCAVVATDVGGNPELLDHGRAGLLVPARDPEELARAVLRLLKDREERIALASAAENRAREHFDLRIIASQLEEIYREALARK